MSIKIFVDKLCSVADIIEIPMFICIAAFVLFYLSYSDRKRRNDNK